MQIMSVDTVTRSIAETAAYYETVLRLPVRKEIGAVEVTVGRSVVRFREDADAEGDQHYAFLIDDARFDSARAFLAAGPGLLGDGVRGTAGLERAVALLPRSGPVGPRGHSAP